MRDQILDFLKKELIGPDPIPPLVQDNGEEILKEPPRLRYGAGILFPQAAPLDEMDTTDETEAKMLDEAATEIDETEDFDLSDEGEGRVPTDADDSFNTNDEILNLAYAFLPSARGVSCFLDVPSAGLAVDIVSGR